MLDDLTRQDLLALLEAHARSWLAHDGCWFLAVEDKRGLEEAVELDKRAWERFSPLEARRLMSAMRLPAGGGLDSLEKVLGLRMAAFVNKQKLERTDGRLVLSVVECRVQKTRRAKGLPDFHCAEVGIVEYSGFASAVDPRIKTRRLSCFPGASGGEWCSWEFTLQ